MIDEQQIIVIMFRTWLSKILSFFSHTKHKRRKQQSKYDSTINVSKVLCRMKPRTFDNNPARLPLLVTSLNHQSMAGFLNESQNCAEISPYEYTTSITRFKRNPSLIAIHIDDDDDEYSRINKSKHSRSLIKLTDCDSSLTISSYCSRPHRCLAKFIRKQTSDSIIFAHRQRHVHSKKRSLSDYSPHNTNSITYDSPMSDTLINSTSSSSDVLTSLNRTKEKTWRLQIHDDLNKDGSRHNVMHKGSEESIRKNRQNKRAKRSEAKKRKIEERVQQANQRWQKYSNIDYELVLFISRYSDQLPLCSNCRNYFITHQTQVLTEDPRASIDYAADAVLHSPNHKTMTMKQAAKARLIQDYDKQSDILFNLCDTCLTKCEQIRNELKQINFTQKILNESNDSPSLSPTISSPISPSPSTQTTVTDLNQIYLNNLIQNHQIRLQQLYQQSQNIIIAQQYYPFENNQQQLHSDLQTCIKQMQYHCLEMLHLQYPGCSFSFPFTPEFNPQCLSYRYQQTDDDDDESTDSEEDENQQSMDDRLTIETCHGLVEYCNAPLDDFIRGLQVLKCLSNFNCYSS